MRIVSFSDKGQAKIGLRMKDVVVDLSVAAPKLPRDMLAFIAGGKAVLAAAKKAAAKAKGKAVIAEKKVKYLPAVPNPGKIICIGLNYVDHAAEAKMQKPVYPVLFGRFASTLVAHRAPMIVPKCSSNFDYEAEVVCVIGKRCRNVPRDKALSVVYGWSLFNEGSIRDYQFKNGPSSQWTMGKNFDGTGGFGPEIATVDELPKGAVGLRLMTRLNGKVLQDANTRDMIFDVAEQIAVTSEVMTLEPGDIIVTGTPAGVGFARNPQIFMKDGDVCEISLEGFGTLVNPIKNA